MTTFEGKFIGKDLKIAIVVARFNEFITSKLLGGAMDGLVRNEVAEDDIDVYWVPGAFEIPFMTKKIVASGKYDGVITLGSVIMIWSVMKWLKGLDKSISLAIFQLCLV